MRKEVLVAILIGALLGLVVAFGIWSANQALAPKVLPSPPPTPEERAVQQGLIVTEPESGAVVSRDRITVRGSASLSSTVVILTNLNEIIAEVASDGSFNQEVELEGGPNEIKVVAYDGEGNREEITLIVVYSTEFPGE